MPSKSVGMSVNPTMRLSGIMLIPMYERRAAPFSMIPSTIRCTRLMGSANPTPLLVLSKLRIWVLTPITSPALFNNGPPELPGLTSASV